MRVKYVLSTYFLLECVRLCKKQNTLLSIDTDCYLQNAWQSEKMQIAKPGTMEGLATEYREDTERGKEIRVPETRTNSITQKQNKKEKKKKKVGAVLNEIYPWDP